MTTVANETDAFNGQAKWIWSIEGVEQIAPLDAHRDNYRVRFFRRTFDAPAGAKLVVHLSADSRYLLWCNGTLVCRGPARGDVAHQFYESLDLTSLLKPGQKNVLAVLAIYFGDCLPSFTFTGAPCGVMTAAPGFILDGGVIDGSGNIAESLATDAKWKVLIDPGAYRHEHCENNGTFTGFTERFDASKYPWGWQSASFDDSTWPAAREGAPGVTPGNVRDTMMPHRLIPRPIPLMEQKPERFDSVRGEHRDWVDLIQKDEALTFAPRTRTSVILQMNALTTACPRVRFSGGVGAKIRLTYAEAMSVNNVKVRGKNCDGQVDGVYDEITADGGKNRVWEAWAYRTYRWVRVDVITGDSPLTIGSLDAEFWAYPYELKASFTSDDPFLSRLFEVCYRTIRLCSHETFEDCPYYEQLSYGGDIAVESDIAAYTSGDLRLVKLTLDLFDWSRNPEGITMSRYPCRLPQIIPFWSQFWIVSVFNYFHYSGDLEQVRKNLDGVEAVVRWFERKRLDDGKGVVGKLNYWSIMDWSLDWNAGTLQHGAPPGVYTEGTALASFFHVWCMRLVSQMAQLCGESAKASDYAQRANELSKISHAAFWDEKEGVYRDRKQGNEFSQFTNALAILSDVAHPEHLSRIAPRLVDDRLARAAYFGMHFVFHALAKVDRFDLFFDKLGTYRKIIDEQDLTTMPEDPTNQRSDCHAWSAAPAYHLLASALGVKPGAPGFAKLLIAPQPGPLMQLSGEVPTPHGQVKVEMKLNGKSWKLSAQVPKGIPTRVTLPDGTSREFPSGGSITFG